MPKGRFVILISKNATGAIGAIGKIEPRRLQLPRPNPTTGNGVASTSAGKGHLVSKAIPFNRQSFSRFRSAAIMHRLVVSKL